MHPLWSSVHLPGISASRHSFLTHSPSRFFLFSYFLSISQSISSILLSIFFDPFVLLFFCFFCASYIRLHKSNGSPRALLALISLLIQNEDHSDWKECDKSELKVRYCSDFLKLRPSLKKKYRSLAFINNLFSEEDVKWRHDYQALLEKLSAFPEFVIEKGDKARTSWKNAVSTTSMDLYMNIYAYMDDIIYCIVICW